MQRSFQRIFELNIAPLQTLLENPDIAELEQLKKRTKAIHAKMEPKKPIEEGVLEETNPEEATETQQPPFSATTRDLIWKSAPEKAKETLSNLIDEINTEFTELSKSKINLIKLKRNLRRDFYKFIMDEAKANADLDPSINAAERAKDLFSISFRRRYEMLNQCQRLLPDKIDAETKAHFSQFLEIIGSFTTFEELQHNVVDGYISEILEDLQNNHIAAVIKGCTDLGKFITDYGFDPAELLKKKNEFQPYMVRALLQARGQCSDEEIGKTNLDAFTAGLNLFAALVKEKEEEKEKEEKKDDLIPFANNESKKNEETKPLLKAIPSEVTLQKNIAPEAVSYCKKRIQKLLTQDAAGQLKIIEEEKRKNEKDIDKLQMHRIKAIFQVTEGLSVAGLYSTFLQPFLSTFFAQYGFYMLGPLIVLANLVMIGLSWRDAYLHKGKTSWIGRAAVETVAGLAISVALIGMMAYSVGFAVATPIIFVASISLKVAWHIGNVIYNLAKYFTAGPMEQNKKAKYLQRAKENAISVGVGLAALATAVGVFLVAKAPVIAVAAPIGIGIALATVGLTLYAAITGKVPPLPTFLQNNKTANKIRDFVSQKLARNKTLGNELEMSDLSRDPDLDPNLNRLKLENNILEPIPVAVVPDPTQSQNLVQPEQGRDPQPQQSLQINNPDPQQSLQINNPDLLQHEQKPDLPPQLPKINPHFGNSTSVITNVTQSPVATNPMLRSPLPPPLLSSVNGDKEKGKGLPQVSLLPLIPPPLSFFNENRLQRRASSETRRKARNQGRENIPADKPTAGQADKKSNPRLRTLSVGRQPIQSPSPPIRKPT